MALYRNYKGCFGCVLNIKYLYKQKIKVESTGNAEDSFIMFHASMRRDMIYNSLTVQVYGILWDTQQTIALERDQSSMFENMLFLMLLEPCYLPPWNGSV